MTDLLVFLAAFAVFIGVWWFVVKRMKAMGKGGLIRHLLGGVLGFFAWVVALLVMLGATGQLEEPPVAKSSKSDSSEQQPAAISSEAEGVAAPASNDEPVASTEDQPNEGESVVVAAENSETGPEQYSSVFDMVEKMSDYPPELDQFEILSEDPLHFRISPVVFQADSREVIYYSNWRAAIYGIYNTFIHTDVDHVTVDAIPRQYVSLKDRENPEMLTGSSVTIDINREDALMIVQSLITSDSLADLKDDKGGYYGWSDDFLSLYYEDRDPGLGSFIEKLSEFCSNDCPTAPPSAAEVETTSGGPEFKGGPYVACLTEELLDQFITAATDRDQRGMEYLLGNGCFSPHQGVPVSVLDWTWTGKLHVRAYGDQGAVEVWTVRDAVVGYNP